MVGRRTGRENAGRQCRADFRYEWPPRVNFQAHGPVKIRYFWRMRLSRLNNTDIYYAFRCRLLPRHFSLKD